MLNSGISRRRVLATLAAAVASGVAGKTAFAQADPLPSWNDGAVKQAILDFVKRVTQESGADFVPIPARIATFPSISSALSPSTA